MRSSTLLSTIVAFSSLAMAAQDAPIVTNNPGNAYFLANMPSGGDKDVVAQVFVGATADGVGCYYNININGPHFNSSGFLYHIHEKPVPSDGNCTGAAAHLDPYGRGEDPICDASSPQTCQVGDLSGKYGTIPSLPGFSKNFTDKYCSLTPGTPAFVGDKSFVLHYPNKTRIACANFAGISGSSSPNSTSSGSGSGSNATGSVTSGTLTPSSTSGAAGGSAAPSSAASVRYSSSWGSVGLLGLLTAVASALL